MLIANGEHLISWGRIDPAKEDHKLIEHFLYGNRDFAAQLGDQPKSSNVSTLGIGELKSFTPVSTRNKNLPNQVGRSINPVAVGMFTSTFKCHHAVRDKTMGEAAF